MSKAEELFAAAFSKPRDARSAEYKQGVLDTLKMRLHETNGLAGKAIYRMGTAAADAYYAGCDEGHRIARDHLNPEAA